MRPSRVSRMLALTALTPGALLSPQNVRLVESSPTETHAERQRAGNDDNSALWGLGFERSQPLPCATVRALSVPSLCAPVIGGREEPGTSQGAGGVYSVGLPLSPVPPCGSPSCSLGSLFPAPSSSWSFTFLFCCFPAALRPRVGIYKYFELHQCLLYWNPVFTGCPCVCRTTKTCVREIVKSLEVT